ncbi:MAG: flavodoxin family protein [Dehalococcoidia bacterium]|nr:flavodoxin family protein [Dehalococcoidia bacterium]
MKALIVYDSMYGNTEKIAKSVGGAITNDVMVLRAGEASPSELESIDLLIVGSPTQGFRPTKLVQTFVESIPGDTLKGIDAAAFDTRFPTSEVGTGLRLFMKMGGYAAGRIAEALKKKGGNLVVAPEGFFVNGKEGPLKEGELERAASWAKGIIESKK